MERYTNLSSQLQPKTHDSGKGSTANYTITKDSKRQLKNADNSLNSMTKTEHINDVAASTESCDYQIKVLTVEGDSAELMLVPVENQQKPQQQANTSMKRVSANNSIANDGYQDTKGSKSK
jgi:hypothetical protein